MHNKCFVLIPGRIDRPVGGHKVIYQYTNFLVENGWSVVIVNNTFAPSKENKLIELLRICHAIIRSVLRVLCKEDTCRGWFPLSPLIEEKSVWTFDRLVLSKDDYCIATDATTSPYLNDYPLEVSHKIYFIQHYENWQMSDVQLRNTYHYDMKRVVISRWLGKILDEEGVDYSIVPNGFDTNEFYLSIPIEEKDKYLVSMLYHESPWKNAPLGFAALSEVKKRIPQLRVVLFGVYNRPDTLPDWYEYFQNPTITNHNMINNRAAVYVGTSLEEGWGLTVGEAMMCGQAVACTDANGYLEMAVDGENALVSHVNDASALAENIIRLINDDELRFRIAKNGLRDIASFSVENSYKKFKSALGL